MKVGHSMGSERVLECARSAVASCPGGREAAPELFAAPSGDGPAYTEAESSILSIPAWVGARGAICFRQPPPSAGSSASRLTLLVVWLEPRPQPAPGFPSQLALDLPAGRYAILTYDAEKQLAVGLETASGPPVVCGPPFDGAAVAVLVRPLARRYTMTPVSLGTTFTAGACLAYLAWLVLEHHLARKHRKAIRHVIHVNGIRGKSSVSRLIDAGLRAGGFRVLTKTTGTSPELIHTDGSETPLARRGRPSIKEQLGILRLAARERADVLVIECMAVLPEYQQISEERMLRSDIGVITNVRPDHLDEMGETLDAIAESLSNTIPKGGTLFTADATYAGFFAERARSKGSSIVLSESGDIEGPPIDFAENVALALAVCQHLGIARETALEGMAQYRPDPGAFRVERSVGKSGKQLVFLNAMAANDPASAEKILDRAEAQGLMSSGRRMLLVNNRHDRPARLRQFVDFAVQHQDRFDDIVAAGASRLLMRRALVRRGIAPERITRLGSYAELYALEHDAVVFAVGNIVGSGQVHVAADRHTGRSHG